MIELRDLLIGLAIIAIATYAAVQVWRIGEVFYAAMR